MASLVAAARRTLLPLGEVTELGSLRRSTTLFSQGQPADSLYIIEEGMVKLTRTSRSSGRIILGIFGPGHVVGEETLLEEPSTTYYADAEILTVSTVFRVPGNVLPRVLAEDASLALALYSAIIRQKVALAEKAELLCLHDVEYRILHYLEQLSSLVAPNQDGEGHQLPITQLELADLIGATRETTSTTLNQLERRGLIKLSRRLLTIPSPPALQQAASAKSSSVNGARASATL